MIKRYRQSLTFMPLLIFASCGSPAERADGSNASLPVPTKAAASIDPCSLVSAEEVTAVTGEKVLRAQVSGGTCTFETEDSASTVTLQVKPEGAAAEMDGVRGANKLLGNIGGQLKGKDGAAGDVGNALSSDTSAPKIGDEALFDASQQLHVRKGDVYISVAPPIMRSRTGGGMPLLSSEQRRSMAAEIAQKAVAKL